MNEEVKNLKESSFAKKSLGQNFLKSSKALNDIVVSSNISDGDLIVEVGPGLGYLTEKILDFLKENNLSKCKLIAIEKDDRLIEVLKDKFKANTQFELIHGDILEINMSDILENNKTNPKAKLIANIPYYITGAIIRKGVDEDLFDSMTLLVQKEVAERASVRDGKESLLSLSIASYGICNYISTVKAGSFVPAPKIDSAVIFIKRNDSNIKFNKKIFFDLIHAGFAHKRKTLMHNLKVLSSSNNSETDYSHVNWVNLFEKNNLDLKVRAEDLKFANFVELANQLEKDVI